MNEKELFLKGHMELIKLVQMVNYPRFYAQAGAIPDSELDSLAQGGQIIQGFKPVGHGIELLHAFSQEDTSLILKTFAESHLRLQ